MKTRAILATLVLLGACETVQTTGSNSGPPAAPIPSTPIELGEWRNGAPDATLQAFQTQISARYSEGQAASAVLADLRRNDFACADNVIERNGRGNPPDQICRHTATANNCTHTWQVQVFESEARITQARALYDRRCGRGADSLLGSPG